ncbi:MAG: 3-deoxy-7-phosphoheptulonate synthase, partial [Halieaceae bacterium]|nr:3-deoxy-7-phosphoheptulonate synthase [Halieaceae bacterium]
MSQNTDDIRIDNARPLITPWVLADQLPGGATAKATVSS